MSQTELFLVVSSGYCGSLWLAASLDKHPDISCTANALLGLSLPHDSGFDFGAQDPGVTNAMIRDQSIATIDDLFDRVIARKPATAAGDVHGYRVSTYRDAVAKAAPRPATLAHLVRHPAVLLERITQEQIHRYKSFPRIQQAMNTTFEHVCGILGPLLKGINWQIGTDRRGLGFLFGLYELILVIQDVRNAPEIPLWTFEQLSSDREVFARLIAELSKRAVTASESYLDQIFDPQNLDNSGRYRKTGVNMASQPAEVFASWQPQEQLAFRRLVGAMGLPALYASAGYDFQFAT